MFAVLLDPEDLAFRRIVEDVLSGKFQYDIQNKADKNRSQCGNGAGRVLCNDKGKNPCSKPGDAETGGDDILGFVPLMDDEEMGNHNAG